MYRRPSQEVYTLSKSKANEVWVRISRRKAPTGCNIAEAIASSAFLMFVLFSAPWCYHIIKYIFHIKLFQVQYKLAESHFSGKWGDVFSLKLKGEAAITQTSSEEVGDSCWSSYRLSCLQEMKVKVVSHATFSSSKDRRSENSRGLEGSMRGHPGHALSHIWTSRLRNSRWQRCRISQAICSLQNYWKDVPNICPQASLKSSPTSSHLCLLLLHLSPSQGHPKHAGRELGRAILGLMCLVCLKRSFCVQARPAEFNWKSNSFRFFVFNVWMSECCFLGFGPSCCLSAGSCKCPWHQCWQTSCQMSKSGVVGVEFLWQLHT